MFVYVAPVGLLTAVYGLPTGVTSDIVRGINNPIVLPTPRYVMPPGLEIFVYVAPVGFDTFVYGIRIQNHLIELR